MADTAPEPDNNSNENANGDSVAQKPYVCDICNSRFSVKISLVRHKIIHTDLHICKFCGKHFSSKYDLEIRHMYIHTHEFPFKCDVCGKGFKRRMLLTQHICSGVSAVEELPNNSMAMAENVNIKRKSIESTDQPINSKKLKSEIVQEPPLHTPENSMSINHHVDTMSSVIPVDSANYDSTNGATVKQVSETELTSLSLNAANNYYDNQMPSSNLVYEQNVASYEQMLPTTVYDQSTMPSSSDIYNLTAVPIANNMYDNTVPVTNNMYTGAQYAATDPNNYSHIDLNSAEINNYISVHQDQSGVIPVEQQTSSTSNQDLINSLNVPTADGSSVVKNELLTMLMSGTSLDNFTNINSHLYSMPGVSNQGANKGLPTFRDTFAQNSQYVLSPQPAPVMNAFVNPNSGMQVQIQPQLTASSPDLKPETYTNPSTPDSAMTADDISEEQAGGLVKRRNKNFKCHICKKRYHKQASVDKHMRIHLDPFVCKICDKRFLKEIHLEKHLLAHNAEDNIKNNISSGLDDILKTVSSADFVVENDRFDTGNEDSISDSIEDDSSSILSPASTVTEDKPLSCSVCKKSYQTKLHLDKHMIIHTNPYVCTICRKKFLRLEFLEKHIAMHRAEESYRKETVENMNKNGVSPQASPYPQASSYNPMSTPQNSAAVSTPQFTSAGLVQLPTPNNTEDNHPEKIRASKPFSCNICKKSYVLESHYAKHMVLHNNPFKCHICSKTFTTKTFLRIHLRKFHDIKLLESESLDINLGDYDTDNALLSEINLNEINPTIVEHLSQNQTPLLSPTSTQNTSSLPSTIPVHDVSSLQIQIPMVTNPQTDAKVPAYQTPDAVSQPTLPSISISTPVQRQLAMETTNTVMMIASENEPKLKPYACTHCNKRYQLQANLTAHMKVHTDPVICKICGKKFASPYLLNKLHMPVHNVDGEANSVLIKTEHTSSTIGCQDGTTSQYTETPIIQTNISNEQPQPILKNDDQRFTSTSTTIVTTNTPSEPSEPQELSNEMLANTALQNKPFVCHICNKRYSVKVNLTKHMVIHMNPFVCKICGKKFLSKKALEEKHMPIHTGEIRNQEKLQNILPAPAVHQPIIYQPIQVQQVSQIALQPLTVKPPPTSQSVIMNSVPQSHEIPVFTNNIKPQANANNIYSCPICHKRFFKKDKMDVHFFNHSKKYSCLICGESFSNRKELEEIHLKKHGNKQHVPDSTGTLESSSGSDKEPQPVNGAEALMMITYDCSTCGKKYNSPKFLKRHLKLHTGEFACKICGKLFSNQYLLDKKHMLTHLDQTSAFNPELGIGLFRCSFCKKTYTFKKNLDKHLDGHKIPSNCKVCPHVCVTKEGLLKHQADHLENEMIPLENIGQPPPVNATKGPPTLQYFAALAVMMYPRGDEVQLALGEKLAELTLQKLEQDELKSNSGMDETDNSFSEEKDKSSWLDCPHCDKKYSQRQYLERHMTVHTNPYVCKICGKAFSSSYALDVKHMLIHSEERPFKCTVCSMAFKELRRLRDHVNKKHYDQTPHVCSKCGFRFQQEHELEEHMKTHVKQNFRCGDCFKLCHSQFTLNEHMKRHTGQKNVHCEQCGNMFVYQSMFDKHLLYTDKENIQYVCPPCSQSFSDKAQFYIIGLMFEGKNTKGNKNEKNEVSVCDPANTSAKNSEIQNVDYQENDVIMSESNLCDKQYSAEIPLATNSTNGPQTMETETSSTLVNESVADVSAVKVETDTVVFNDSGAVSQPESIVESNNSKSVNCESVNENISDTQIVQSSNVQSDSVHISVHNSQMQSSGNISQSESNESKMSEMSNSDSVPTSEYCIETKTDIEITPCVSASVPEMPNQEFSILKSALTNPQTNNSVSDKTANSSSTVSDKPNMAKDFKTFTDIMIEKLICNDDKSSGANKQPSILDQLIKSESTNNTTI